ncbi:PIN domain-containing protein [Candidatus Parcubacteria bacterium]|nr:PIN domain-containing protein [Candidatus Parcubacteria bacterium]
MPKTKPTIYLETSVISAYFDFKKQDNQRKKETQDFFKFELPKYSTFISEIVARELSVAKSMKHRQLFLKIIKDIPVLPFSREAATLRDIYMKANLVPKVKIDDAGHLAIATVHNIKVVLSWNYNHIANYFVQEKANALNTLHNYPNLLIDFPSKFLTR